eukprot:TRINITY_DN2634_c0_g1_i2.p1 TRINITY_DN2634_c0_g1~~TRINITY_DN2634_c0_g1_i2.p1  ORF type:complete len:374 (-),score=79.59 TRINITY_DN2634_c0_g1_i2:67-1188(-)
MAEAAPAPFSSTLLERFQQNGLMRLQPNQFLLVVRRMGARFSSKECAAVVKHVGTDAQGYVNIHGFCQWFENIENELRLSRCAETSQASGQIEGAAQDSSVDLPSASVASGEFANVVEHGLLGEDAVGGASREPVEIEIQHIVNVVVHDKVEEDKVHIINADVHNEFRIEHNINLEVRYEVEEDIAQSINADVHEVNLDVRNAVEDGETHILNADVHNEVRNEQNLHLDVRNAVEDGETQILNADVHDEVGDGEAHYINADVYNEVRNEQDVNADSGHNEVEEEEARSSVGILRQHRRLPSNRSVQFDPEVQSDDGSLLRLDEAEDKFTLPSHRKLSEHEKLMASFRADLVEVKARLESGQVKYRQDLVRNPP